MAMIKRQAISDYIMRMLGYPVVGVELEPVMIDQAIDVALEEYLATGAVEKAYYSMPAKPETNVYDLPDEIGTVTNVVYPMPFQIMAGSAQDMFSFAAYNAPFGPGTGNMLHGSANLGIFYEYIQNRNRLVGNDITWEVVDNKIYLYPYPKMGQPIIVQYSKNIYTIQDPEQKAISTSNSWGIYWIQRYSLAVSKNMLGLVRGKYSTIAGGTGDQQTLNSAELLSQAKTEIEALKEELASHHSHIQFFVS
jgi:hypothetical protein